MVPELVPIQEFFDKPSVVKALESLDKLLPVALDNEDVEAFCLDFKKISHISVVGTHNIGKTNIIKVILESLARKARPFAVHIVDSNMLRLSSYQERFSNMSYLTEKKEISDLLKDLCTEVKHRRDIYTQKIISKEITLPAAEYYTTLLPQIVIVNNLATFISKLSPEEQFSLGQLLDDSHLTGIHFCFVSNVQDFPLRNYEKLGTALKNVHTGFTFIPFDKPQPLPVPVHGLSSYSPLKTGETYFIHTGSATLVKFPWVSIDRTM
jgi:hypothetical protein